MQFVLGDRLYSKALLQALHAYSKAYILLAYAHLYIHLENNNCGVAVSFIIINMLRKILAARKRCAKLAKVNCNSTVGFTLVSL